jgi:glyoxylase-like metal-dependent hydrolase (beta-lactamase superfamily II)
MGGLTEVADGVLAGTSELYMITTTVVVGGDGGCLVIDPAITAADLARLAAELTALPDGADHIPRLGVAHWQRGERTIG